MKQGSFTYNFSLGIKDFEMVERLKNQAGEDIVSEGRHQKNGTCKSWVGKQYCWSLGFWVIHMLCLPKGTMEKLPPPKKKKKNISWLSIRVEKNVATMLTSDKVQNNRVLHKCSTKMIKKKNWRWLPTSGKEIVCR